MSTKTRKRPGRARAPGAAKTRRASSSSPSETVDDRVRARIKKRAHPEDDIQIEVVRRLRAAGVRFFHCPNESKVPAHYRAKLRAKGVSAGVPDLVIVTPLPNPELSSYRYPAALEIKAEKGRLSEEQREWLAHLHSIGWATAVTYGLEDTLRQLRAWGYLE